MRAKRWAGVKRTARFIYVAAESGRFGVAADRAEFAKFLPADASPAEVGRAVRAALARSRYFDDDAQLKAFFDYSRLELETQQWEQEATRLYAYESTDALYSSMQDVRAVLGGAELILHPTRQHAQGWTRAGVPASGSRATSIESSDEKIGQVVLEALNNNPL